MTAALSDNAVISQFDPETGLILYFEPLEKADADTIEGKYNIKIMLGDEALNIGYGGVFKPESTENAESEMSV